jgi:P27 family predicted phage terminase small subunit
MMNWEDIKKEVETTKRSYRSIAKDYGVNYSTISKKAKNEGWKVEHRINKKSSKSVDCPHKKVLGKIALRKIEEIKKELGNKYSPVDEPLIVMCSRSYEEYLELAEKVSIEGHVLVSPKTNAKYLNPTFNAYQAVQKTLITVANQLGLSIASRKKLGISFDKKENEGQSSIFDFTKLLNDDEDLENI